MSRAIFQYLIGWLLSSVLLSFGGAQETEPSGSRPANLLFATEADTRSGASLKPPMSIQGCMNSACHGSREQDAPIWQRAGSIWFDSDPHARAYTDLLSNRSRGIVASLVGVNSQSSDSMSETVYASFLEARCISCHASERAPPAQWVLGADCQVCHGPAEAWGPDHYQSSRLNSGSKRFQDTGRTDVESLSDRARVCASCHVGQLERDGRDREVDHRLMAAGHPSMYFDFGSYSAKYPAHWNLMEEEKRLGPFAEYDIWKNGKIETALVRMELLQDRAQRALAQPASHGTGTSGQLAPHFSESHVDWPELTEYRCTSCHHALGVSGWGADTHTNAFMLWDEWYFECLPTMLPPHANGQSENGQDIDNNLLVNRKDWPSGHRAWDTTLSHLRESMESPMPSAEEALTSSQRLIELLRQWSQTNRDRPTTARELRSQFDALLQQEDYDRTWERGTQWLAGARATGRGLNLQLPTLGGDVAMESVFLNQPWSWSPQSSLPITRSETHPRDALKIYRDALRTLRKMQP